MLKIAFFCLVIAISYVTYGLKDTTTEHNPLQIDLLSPNTSDLDEQMQYLTTFNVSSLVTATTTKSNVKGDDMNVYYSWLHYLKTSTATQENHILNITIPENATIINVL